MCKTVNSLITKVDKTNTEWEKGKEVVQVSMNELSSISFELVSTFLVSVFKNLIQSDWINPGFEIYLLENSLII